MELNTRKEIAIRWYYWVKTRTSSKTKAYNFHSINFWINFNSYLFIKKQTTIIKANERCSVHVQFKQMSKEEAHWTHSFTFIVQGSYKNSLSQVKFLFIVCVNSSVFLSLRDNQIRSRAFIYKFPLRRISELVILS